MTIKVCNTCDNYFYYEASDFCPHCRTETLVEVSDYDSIGESISISQDQGLDEFEFEALIEKNSEEHWLTQSLRR